MKVYISGPITGTTDAKERFAQAEERIRQWGNNYEVVNPFKVNANLPESTTWQQYMEMSLCMLSMCEVIYLLEGWKNSKGAKIEHDYAIDHNMAIVPEGWGQR